MYIAVLPPEVVSDAVSTTALMSVPLNVHPDGFGFDDYHHLISLCYEIHGAPGQIVNLVSSRCISVNTRYESPDDRPAETILGSVGIRTVDGNGECKNIQVNKDCSIRYNGQTVSTNFTSGNISFEVFDNFIHLTVPNCGKHVSMKFNCLVIDGTPSISKKISRNYINQDDTHGLIGKGMSYRR